MLTSLDLSEVEAHRPNNRQTAIEFLQSTKFSLNNFKNKQKVVALDAVGSAFNNIFSFLQHFHFFSLLISYCCFVLFVFFREAVILRIGKMVYKMAPKIIE